VKERIIHEKVIFHTFNQDQIERLLAETVAGYAGLELDWEYVSYKVLITRDTATTGYGAKVTLTENLDYEPDNVFTVICALQDRTSTSTYHAAVVTDSSKEAARLALEECAETWECDVDDLVVIGMYRGTVYPAMWDDSGLTLDEIHEL